MEKIKQYLNKEDKMKTGLNKPINVIWGQCSDQLQSSIKYLDDYEAREDTIDIVWLLKNYCVRQLELILLVIRI